MTQVDPILGHRLWAATYDTGPNPLLALETRLLAPRLGPLDNRSFIDVAAGTGRWMQYARSRGARVFGFDLCSEMLLAAAAKSGLAGRLVIADACALPVGRSAADLAVCSFALAYFSRMDAALSELARVASVVIISDIHPRALGRGWTRSFRSGGEVYQIAHQTYSEAHLNQAATRAGLQPRWRIEAGFGEPERPIFRSAGKEALFPRACEIPAVLITAWCSP